KHMVQVARLRANGFHLTVDRMATLALVLVRHGIGNVFRAAIGQRDGERYLCPRDVEISIALIFIPDIGPGMPAAFLPQQKPRLNVMLPAVTLRRWIGEGLDERC